MPTVIRIPIHLGDHDQIMCRHAVTNSRPQGYPVVEIDGPEVDAPLISIMFTRGRLIRLAECLNAYLAAHPVEPARPAVAEAVLDHDDLLMSAMAAGSGPKWEVD